MARVNSNGRTGQRYTSSPEGVADGAVPGSPPGTGSGGGDEYDVANGRCLPYLIMACIFGRGGRSRGQHSSGRKPKNVFRVKESESIVRRLCVCFLVMRFMLQFLIIFACGRIVFPPVYSIIFFVNLQRESAVVPVNADGSRVTTPRRIAVEPLSLPGRRSPGPGHGGESPLSGVSGASPQQSPMTPQRLGEQGNSPGAPPFAPKANHGGDAMAIAQVGAAAASSSSPDHPNPQYPQQQQNQQNQQQGRTNMNKYGSIKHRHHHHRENDPAERISTMGLESVRLRSPRSPRGDGEGEPSPRSKKKDKRDRGDRGDKGSRSERGGGGSPVNVADTVTDTVGVQQALQLAEKPPYPYVASSTSQQDLAGLPNTTSSSSSPSPRSRGSTSPRGRRSKARDSGGVGRGGRVSPTAPALAQTSAIEDQQQQQQLPASSSSVGYSVSTTTRAAQGAQEGINIELNSGVLLDNTPPSAVSSVVKEGRTTSTSRPDPDRRSPSRPTSPESVESREWRASRGATGAGHAAIAGKERGYGLARDSPGPTTGQDVSAVLAADTGSGKNRTGRVASTSSSSRKKRTSSSAVNNSSAVENTLGAEGGELPVDPAASAGVFPQPADRPHQARTPEQQFDNPRSSTTRPGSSRTHAKSKDSCTVS